MATKELQHAAVDDNIHDIVKDTVDELFDMLGKGEVFAWVVTLVSHESFLSRSPAAQFQVSMVRIKSLVGLKLRTWLQQLYTSSADFLPGQANLKRCLISVFRVMAATCKLPFWFGSAIPFVNIKEGNFTAGWSGPNGQWLGGWSCALEMGVGSTMEKLGCKVSHKWSTLTFSGFAFFCVLRTGFARALWISNPSRLGPGLEVFYRKASMQPCF